MDYIKKQKLRKRGEKEKGSVQHLEAKNHHTLPINRDILHRTVNYQTVKTLIKVEKSRI